MLLFGACALDFNLINMFAVIRQDGQHWWWSFFIWSVQNMWWCLNSPGLYL